MKKFLMVFIMLVVALCVVGCGDKKDTGEVNLLDNSGDALKKPIVKYFAEEDLDKFASIQTIKLPEDSTTNYEWIYIVDDAEVVQIAKDEFVLNEGLDVIEGGNGYRICELKGLSSGETVVYFECVNPLDQASEALDVVKFYIEVNENNEIAITDEVH